VIPLQNIVYIFVGH